MSHTTEKEPIYIDSFNYELPDERIAKYPLTRRDSSKLLLYRDGTVSESHFANLAQFLLKYSNEVCGILDEVVNSIIMI